MQITIVNGTIIENEKIVLLKKKHKNYYEFPGGKLKSGENEEKCLQRELFEEIGIKITKWRKRKEHKFKFEGKNITDHSYFIKKYSGKVKNNEPDVFEEMIWCPLKLLKDLPLAPNVKSFSERR